MGHLSLRQWILSYACCGIIAAQPPARSNWSVQDVTAKTRKEIDTGLYRLAPREGSMVLDVRAVVRAADAAHLQIRTRNIFVETVQRGSVSLTTSELVGVGLVAGATGACAYALTKRETILGDSGTQATGVAIGSGHGFTLDWESTREATKLTVEDNPQQLCLAFVVAEGMVRDRITLHMEGATASVKLP
jgi:hypothetical protein